MEVNLTLLQNLPPILLSAHEGCSMQVVEEDDALTEFYLGNAYHDNINHVSKEAKRHLGELDLLGSGRVLASQNSGASQDFLSGEVEQTLAQADGKLGQVHASIGSGAMRVSIWP
ncbi:hypothetical protein V6N11_053823 [Hibiscus sabdariffa]|uniref:Uncharacterized protein n=1 Tax=Hibiscus sabdariffa TaxID=183260 RepID=A0ABR2S305_9ROSI